MSLTITPVPARTDDPAAPAAGSARLVRRAGLAVGLGAAIWGTTMFFVSPATTDPVGITIGDAGALPFQAGLFVLVTAQLRTMATGTSRLARGMLKAEYVLLALATLWTVLHGAFWSFRDDTWLAVLDVFWPLSMLGMFVIGVKIAFAGRWRGTARVWPAVAESWAVVTVPAMGVFGAGVGQVVGASHLFVGYGVLGLILALRPHLTGAR